MSSDTRASLMGGLWFCSALALAALFISAAAQGELTLGHVLLAFMLLGLAIAGTPYLLHLQLGENGQEKTKRRRVDTMFRDLSDTELIELKQRLAEVEFDEAMPLDRLGDDGELVRQVRN